jgi:DNA polymerase III subunit gamma/tau
VLYGKWRPQGFAEVVGQESIVTTLRNALASGQVAHAYLFCGPRGTGKTTTARILARALNCVNIAQGEPCNACPACLAISRGAALDLIEMDAASNRGIDDIRELREKIGFAPSDLQKKVYLLDEVHMLTDGAFNALLKTLEEPPPHAVFILATTESHKLPATIISRCQRYDFRRIANDALVGLLRDISAKEGFEVPDQGLLQISIQSRGGARDAITLLEQVVARYGNTPSTDQVLEALGLVHDERSEKIVAAILSEDLATALDIARQVADDGVNIARFTREALDILRAVLPQVLRGSGDPDSPYRRLAEDAIAAGRTPAQVAIAIQELAKADFRLDPASPIPLEVACAAAVLGPSAPPAAVAVAPGARPGGPPAARAAGARPGGNGPRADDPALSREERFLQELYQACRLQSPQLAGWLNDSCKVLTLDDEVLELGFWSKMHMEKVDAAVRPLIEQQAERLLSHPVVLKLRITEKEQVQRRAPRGGHLAEAAKALGAVPIGKDS